MNFKKKLLLAILSLVSASCIDQQTQKKEQNNLKSTSEINSNLANSALEEFIRNPQIEESYILPSFLSLMRQDPKDSTLIMALKKAPPRLSYQALLATLEVEHSDYMELVRYAENAIQQKNQSHLWYVLYLALHNPRLMNDTRRYTRLLDAAKDLLARNNQDTQIFEQIIKSLTTKHSNDLLVFANKPSSFSSTRINDTNRDLADNAREEGKERRRLCEEEKRKTLARIDQEIQNLEKQINNRVALLQNKQEELNRNNECIRNRKISIESTNNLIANLNAEIKIRKPQYQSISLLKESIKPSMQNWRDLGRLRPVLRHQELLEHLLIHKDSEIIEWIRVVVLALINQPNNTKLNFLSLATYLSTSHESSIETYSQALNYILKLFIEKDNWYETLISIDELSQQLENRLSLLEANLRDAEQKQNQHNDELNQCQNNNRQQERLINDLNTELSALRNTLADMHQQITNAKNIRCQ